MKMMIFLMAFAVSSVSVAATCPKGTKLALSCKSAPQAGDEVVAADAFDSVTICNDDSKTYMDIAKGKESSGPAEVKVITRPGGTSYLAEYDEASFTLNVTTGINSKTLPAKLVANYPAADLKISASYKCK